MDYLVIIYHGQIKLWIFTTDITSAKYESIALIQMYCRLSRAATFNSWLVFQTKPSKNLLRNQALPKSGSKKTY